MRHCGVVVKKFLAGADVPGSTPGDAVFLFLCPFFSVFFFNTKFGVLLLKRDFKSSWSAYWPSLRPEKTISCQDMSLPLKQLNFFQCQLTSWQTLIYTQHPPVTHWWNLNLPFVHRLYHYPKTSTWFAPPPHPKKKRKKKEAKPFNGFRDFITVNYRCMPFTVLNCGKAIRFNAHSLSQTPVI